ncbi:hypothetical protein KP803_06480 [Vibrio sp. ZSDE26]|uniref:Uncharacterized protein n=1 Tax=Vibrio amylolyticus TaxID=2847292 RepID=A0A9X1XJD8_9VIBR|nr:hypothetical protein [Vibrio amylolyticus]MCK6262923.1 hypothetical protein [Vibrio amylolyticus]
MKTKRVIALLLGSIVFLIIGSKYGLFGSRDVGSFPKLPEEAGFTVSKQFDGEWLGRRINVTGNNMCERTTITGTITNGKALLRLTYNGTPLQGWVSEEGELLLYASNRQWDYRFSAMASKNKIEGKWHLANGPCRGTWYIERQS